MAFCLAIEKQQRKKVNEKKKTKLIKTTTKVLLSILPYLLFTILNLTFLKKI
jgi:hypothetical protein